MPTPRLNDVGRCCNAEFSVNSTEARFILSTVCLSAVCVFVHVDSHTNLKLDSDVIWSLRFYRARTFCCH